MGTVTEASLYGSCGQTESLLRRQVMSWATNGALTHDQPAKLRSSRGGLA
jgi:hypothetical protein